MKQAQQFDVGAQLAYLVLDEAGAPRDLSGFTTASLLLEAPSGRRKRFDGASVAASTVTYSTQPLDLDEFGVWRVQVLLANSSETTRSRVEELRVFPNVDAPELVLRPDVAGCHSFTPTVFASPFEQGSPQNASLSLDAPMIDEELLTAESDYSGGDWSSGDLDASWLSLPIARLAYPKLRNVGVVQWDIACLYYKSGGGAQVIQWELVDNDVPTGAVLSFSNSTATNPPGLVMFQAELRVVHDPSGTTLYDLVGREQRRNNVGATISDLTVSARPSLDSMIDHVLRFRVKKTGITGDGLLVRSIHAIRRRTRQLSS